MIKTASKTFKAATAAFLLFGLPADAMSMATDVAAEKVLAHMSEAYADLAWEGTLVYTKGAHMVSLRLQRNWVAGQPVERLERLSGDSMQLMRRGNWLLGMYPGQEVLRQGYAVPAASVAPLAQRLDHIKGHYTIERGSVERVAGREAIPIKLTANDDLRFHRMFWCDAETGLLLRSQTLVGRDVIEQFEFLQVSVHTPSEQDAIVVDAQGMEVHRHPLVPSDASELIGLTQLPKGFLPLHQSKLENGTLSQLISDGVSMVSIFYEPLDHNGHQLAASDGPTHALSRVVPAQDKWVRITAVGEVPPHTLVSLMDQVTVREISTVFEAL